MWMRFESFWCNWFFKGKVHIFRKQPPFFLEVLMVLLKTCKDQMHANLIASNQLVGTILRERSLWAKVGGTSDSRTVACRGHELCPSVAPQALCLICVSFARDFPRGRISWPHYRLECEVFGKGAGGVHCSTLYCCVTIVNSQASPSGLKTAVLCERHRQ